MTLSRSLTLYPLFLSLPHLFLPSSLHGWPRRRPPAPAGPGGGASPAPAGPGGAHVPQHQPDSAAARAASSTGRRVEAGGCVEGFSCYSPIRRALLIGFEVCVLSVLLWRHKEKRVSCSVRNIVSYRKVGSCVFINSVVLLRHITHSPMKCCVTSHAPLQFALDARC